MQFSPNLNTKVLIVCAANGSTRTQKSIDTRLQAFPLLLCTIHVESRSRTSRRSDCCTGDMFWYEKNLSVCKYTALPSRSMSQAYQNATDSWSRACWQYQLGSASCQDCTFAWLYSALAAKPTLLPRWISAFVATHLSSDLLHVVKGFVSCSHLPKRNQFRWSMFQNAAHCTMESIRPRS